MYSQLYFHHVRRIYDLHLRDFLSAWLADGKFSTDVNEHLEMTDNEVMTAIARASRVGSEPGHDAAKIITRRRHFRLLYMRNPQDIAKNPAAVKLVFRAARENFGADYVRLDDPSVKAKSAPDFPVLMRDDRVVSSLQVSEVLNHIPPTAVGFVFVDPDTIEEAGTWLERNREEIIRES